MGKHSFNWASCFNLSDAGFHSQVGPFDAEFIGRNEELAAVKQKLQNESLLTICGPPGCGKTRLTYRALSELYENNRNRLNAVWLFQLRDVENEPQLKEHLCKLLELPASAFNTLEELLDIMRDKLLERRVILVFNDLDLLSSRIVSKLLSSAPQRSLTRFVITARGRTHAEGETVLELEGLTESHARELYKKRAETNGFSELTKNDHECLDNLLEKLDRLPLAIELVAGRLDVLGPNDILERWDDILDLLSRSRDTSRWEAAMKNSLQRSWRRLDQLQKATLAQISFFEAPFSADTARGIMNPSYVSNSDSIRDVLDELRDQSLIRPSPTDKTQTRYRAYSLVKIFARQKVAPYIRKSYIIPNYIEYWVQRLEQLIKQLRGGAPIDAKEAFEDEQPDILKAFEFACNYCPSKAAKLADPCIVFASYDSLDIPEKELIADARRCLESLDAKPDSEKKFWSTRLKYREYQVQRNGHSDASTLDFLSDLLESANETDDLLTQCGVLHSKAQIHCFRSNYQTALEVTEESLDRLDNQCHRLRGKLLRTKGMIYAHLQQHESAVEIFREALAMFDKAPEPFQQSQCYIGLADQMLAVGRLEETRKYLKRASEVEPVASSTLSIAYNRHLDEAGASLLEENYDIAKKQSRKSLEICQRVDQKWYIPSCLKMLALAHLGCREWSNVHSLLHRSFLQAKANETPLFQMFSIGWQAATYYLEGDCCRGDTFLDETAKVTTGSHSFIELLEGLRATCRKEPLAARVYENIAKRAKRHSSPPIDFDGDSTLDTLLLSKLILREIDSLPDSLSPDQVRPLTVEASEAAWFCVEGEEPVDLSAKSAFKRILAELVAAHHDNRRRAVETQRLVEVGWPDADDIAPDTGALRVYNAISNLRRAGLRGLIVKDRDGYQLIPHLEIKTRRQKPA
jgi:predicted ATPase